MDVHAALPYGERGAAEPAPVTEVAGFVDIDTTGATSVVTVRMLRGNGSVLYRRRLT